MTDEQIKAELRTYDTAATTIARKAGIDILDPRDATALLILVGRTIGRAANGFSDLMQGMEKARSVILLTAIMEQGGKGLADD